MKKNHFLTLDSFRGLCACIVAISHFNANSIFMDSKIFDRGDIYVDFFFVLSGFVIFANYRDKLLSGYSVGKFAILRLGRLYPLHLCVLMGFILIDLLQLLVHIDGAALYAPFSAPGEGIKEILANLFLIHSMHTIDTLAFNGPSWSISVEVFAYLLFALILTWAGRHYRSVVALVSIGSAVALFFLFGELYAKLDYGFLRCVFGFGMGALAYDAYQALSTRIQPILKNTRLVSMVEIFVFIATVIYIGLFSFGGMSMLAPLIFAGVIILFAFERGIVSKILKARPFIFVGTLSYSIYMIHMFISGKLFALPIRLLENRLGWEISFQRNDVTMFGMDKMTGTLLEIFYLLVVIGCSWISFKLIEDPCRNLSRKIVNSGWPKRTQKAQTTGISA